ncbi:hypothetical protein GCM10025777_37170 [Membranihabitans marinus]|uniref:Uncharacterized protein n=1 Tax=Nesterenkonia rhizosphaerae TaxID=1348272 RepID=A0ABP9G1J0_9MICC
MNVRDMDCSVRCRCIRVSIEGDVGIGGAFEDSTPPTGTAVVFAVYRLDQGGAMLPEVAYYSQR